MLLFLGDFAILVNSGMTVCQAAFFNFTSALTCFAGASHFPMNNLNTQLFPAE